MTNQSLYDKIGQNYPTHRRADPRLTAAILELLALPGDSNIADVGAGTGNYSLALARKGFRIKAIEPSNVMRRQRKRHTNIQWISGAAERIPLETNSMDAAMGILSLHHFKDARQSLAEMARISKKGVVLLFTFDPRQIERPWLADYFPFLWHDTFKEPLNKSWSSRQVPETAKYEAQNAVNIGNIFKFCNEVVGCLRELNADHGLIQSFLNYFPPIDNVAHWLGSATGCPVTIQHFELPHDLKDTFAAAGWRRPEMYLDPLVRSCMSGFAIAEQSLVERGVVNLQRDLQTGARDEKYGWLREKDCADVGYRFLLSQSVG